MDSIDQYLIRDVTGLVYPEGETGASTGWVQMELPDKSKQEEGEHASMPTPAFTMASPDFSGLERLLKALQLPTEILKVKLETKWNPGMQEVVLKFSGKETLEHKGMRPGLLMPPISIFGAEKDAQQKYDRSRMYACDSPLLLFQLLDSLTGVSQNTVFRKLSGDRDRGRYSRIYTTTGKLPIS